MMNNKKKHQSDPNESTDSGDENDNISTECPHINKAVDLAKVKKALIRTGIQKECEQCQKMPPAPPDRDNGESDFFLIDNTIWLCLRCGNQGCGREKNQHALQHFNTPHSDSHSICVETEHWSVWCYECDDVVNVTAKKKLQETVEYLQKQAENQNKQEIRASLQYNLDVVEPPMVPLVISRDVSFNFSPPSPMGTSNSPLPRPRGLMNLGNTCYFNSVVQCLAQTPYLLELLNETSQSGQYFRLPGGELTSDGTVKTLEPLEGQLEKWSGLTMTLAETLSELQNGRSEVYSPGQLRGKLVCRVPRFGGSDQHDSHELLRHLVEAVREEDLKRYQTVILEKLGFTRKTDPSTVEDDRKRIIKFYGQQASEMLTPTEQVFRGVLVSTLQCQECQHSNHLDDFFLDLSLPISEKQIPPVLRRKAEEIEDSNKPSKHQIKKEKRAERKRNRCHHNNFGARNLNATVMIGPMNQEGAAGAAADDVNMEDKSDSESDADVEDNTEGAEEAVKGLESGYNSDKVDNSSPDSNIRGVSPRGVNDSGVPSPAAVGMLSASHGTPDNSPASSETNIDMGSPIGGPYSPEEIRDDDDNSSNMATLERPESRLSFVRNKNLDLKMHLSKLSLFNDGDSNKMTPLCDKMEDDDSNNFEGACASGSQKETEEKMEEDEEDVDLWTNTVSPRYQSEEGEYSVQSSLNQFTACELMTGNNKVCCELCTKRYGGADKKNVYTNATKQLLIYNPPAVLILHLKRFQVLRFLRPAKVNKHVKFPTLLDLAPFCSKRSQNLPTFEAGQTRVLYSLYGVVEHSGSMNGGHYVAYVKVRPKLAADSYRWSFLPKNQKIGAAGRGVPKEDEVAEPAGKWYYISDSHVSETTESKVLSAQAYLLFYERIF